MNQSLIEDIDNETDKQPDNKKSQINDIIVIKNASR